MPWTTLCQLNELRDGEGKYVEIGGLILAVYLREEKVYVLDNSCPHAGGNLAGGTIDDGCVVCPWHYWAFHLDNGQLRDTPAVSVTTYPARVLKRMLQPSLVQADLPIEMKS